MIFLLHLGTRPGWAIARIPGNMGLTRGAPQTKAAAAQAAGGRVKPGETSEKTYRIRWFSQIPTASRILSHLFPLDLAGDSQWILVAPMGFWHCMAGSIRNMDIQLAQPTAEPIQLDTYNLIGLVVGVSGPFLVFLIVGNHLTILLVVLLYCLLIVTK